MWVVAVQTVAVILAWEAARWLFHRNEDKQVAKWQEEHDRRVGVWLDRCSIQPYGGRFSEQNFRNN